MLPDDPRPPQLPRRRPWRSDPALFDAAVRPRRGGRALPRLGTTFSSRAPRPRPAQPDADFGWFGGRRPLALLAVLTAAVLLAGCSSGPTAGEGGQDARAAGSGDRDLREVCPATVVVQTSWFSQVEHFVAYQLLGKGYTVDAGRKSVTGPLVASGVDTGVDIEVRAGGPAIGFQQVSAQMYADRSIMLGMVPLDEAIQNSQDQPITGVMTPYDVDPLVIMWDPEAFPDWSTIADIGQTDTRVLFFSGERTYMDYLVGTGQLRQSQVDGSYDGSPDRLVAARGRIAVQGFATSEPWKWQHEVKAWAKPLTYQLVADSGYPNYRNLLAIRAGDKGRLAPCLRRLVPILQQATVDFLAQPGPTIDTILSIVERTRQAYTDSKDRSRHAVDVMREEGLVTNGRTATIGDFDLAPGGRVDRLLKIDVPIFKSQRKRLKPVLVPTDIATNEFLDPAVGLPRSG